VQPKVIHSEISDKMVEGLWDVKELAVYLGKSVRWVWLKLPVPPEQKGSIPTLRIGGTPRFDPDEIRAWTKAGCPPAADFRGIEKLRIAK